MCGACPPCSFDACRVRCPREALAYTADVRISRARACACVAMRVAAQAETAPNRTSMSMYSRRMCHAACFTGHGQGSTPSNGRRCIGRRGVLGGNWEQQVHTQLSMTSAKDVVCGLWGFVRLVGAVWPVQRNMPSKPAYLAPARMCAYMSTTGEVMREKNDKEIVKNIASVTHPRTKFSARCARAIHAAGLRPAAHSSELKLLLGERPDLKNTRRANPSIKVS